MNQEYKDYDDLQLYDSVIESLEINHKTRTLSFRLLKVVSTLDRNEGRNFTYKVKQGSLIFHSVLFTNFSYGLEWGEWSEFYRSAILDSSDLLNRFQNRSNKSLKHVYLGIDNGNEYREIDVICSKYEMQLEDQEFILHDDFDWLYEE
ncbi:hypothetical protein [Bacillus sp. FSL K6-6540]|uniref:hypothetical protein n=1 Tax=Bacillus sp. FSL K6-6540 TaxID=2921512 RepID=UPI0030F7EB30